MLLNKTIITERLTIKPYTEQDEDDMISLLTNDVIRKTFMIPDLPTKEKQQAMFRKLLSWSQSGEHLELGIYLNKRLIGFLNDVMNENKAIELGFVIHPDYHGRGYATEALRATINHLFNLGYHEVVAGAFVENVASMKVIRKCGMEKIDKTEGIPYRGEIRHCQYFSIRKEG